MIRRRVSAPAGRSRRWRPPVLVTLVAMTLAACGGSGGSGEAASTEPAESSSSASSSSESSLSGDVTVFAAASLTESFTTLSESFQEDNPDMTVVFNFGPSSGLSQQITSGAPADVFAAASPATMQTVVDSGDADAPDVFVSNSLQIAVPPDNPGGVTGLADFANADLTIALCAVEVPCGAASEKVFAAAGVRAAPDTLETDVKAALSKVQLGEVDAALVYKTDVIAAGDGVEGIEFPEASEAVNDYPITVLTQAPNSDAAQAFVEYVQSSEGQRVLADAGFDSP